MIHLKQVDLSLRGIQLPSDKVGIVMAQPFVQLTKLEPFRWVGDAKLRQLAAIRTTLQVALTASHGAALTNFTIFPEYSIPGLRGVDTIEAVIRNESWPSGTIIIGGTDGLSRSDFAAIAKADGTHYDEQNNPLDQIGDTQWVNCCITWVKSAAGVERWLQPKISPAWPEHDTPLKDMYNGRSIYCFHGSHSNSAPYRFATFVCFDWVASIGQRKTWQWLTQALDDSTAPHETSLTWIFVIQHNPKPSHVSFLSEVSSFFSNTRNPRVHRESACVVFTNTAGKMHPGRSEDYGASSLVFSHRARFGRPTCRPTYSSGSKRSRPNEELAAFHDLVFRESGACIHSLSQVNPSWPAPGAEGKSLAIETASVHPIDEHSDPRTPSAPVPACIKWLNDQIDQIASLAAQYPAAPLAAEATSEHDRTIASWRTVPSDFALRSVKAAASNSFAIHADDWDVAETEAVEHLIHTIDILSVGQTHPDVRNSSTHARITINGNSLELLAVRGRTHEECITHSKSLIQPPRRQTLLVTRDKDNTDWGPSSGIFLDSAKVSAPGDEYDFTDPRSNNLYLSYSRLLSVFRSAETTSAAQEAIHEALAGQR